METTVRKLKEEMQCMLTGNILPFWMNHMVDSEYGGFYGRISGTGERVPGASKGVVLNARILWTFSSAYRLLHKDEYLKMATRAKQELITHFYDLYLRSHILCFSLFFHISFFKVDSHLVF